MSRAILDVMSSYGAKLHPDQSPVIVRGLIAGSKLYSQVAAAEFCPIICYSKSSPHRRR